MIWKASPALLPKVVSAATCCALRAGKNAAADQAHANERAGLRAMNRQHRCFRRRLRVLAFEVEHLAADHALQGTRRFRNRAARCRIAPPADSEANRDPVGERLQRIAGEDRDGFTVDDVTGGLAAPQIVVVERRQIVMDERVGVDHLDRRPELFHAGGNAPSPATMRAASMHRIGRRRLPPAKTLCRIARWMETGTWSEEGRRRSTPGP